MVPCPSCAYPNPPELQFCLACRVQIAWDGAHARVKLPQIRAGHELIAGLRFPQDPLPNCKRVAQVQLTPVSVMRAGPDGHAIMLGDRIRMTYPFDLHARDAWTRCAMTVWNPGVAVGIAARYDRVGEKPGAETYYVGELCYQNNEARIAKFYSMEKSTGIAIVAGPVPIAPILGRPFALELGVQGPTLDLRIDGHPVLSAHDPMLGTGRWGIAIARRAEPDGTQRSVVVHSFELWGLAP